MTRILYDFPYPSRRMPVMARNVVATSQPLAAQAGLRMLLAGGNAVDAALAAAIALTVVEPTSNGIGSDAFAILWDGSELHGLNASGRSPRRLSRDRLGDATTMPLRGPLPVTVPGAVSAWVELSARFGRLPFARLFEPAIGYARDGFLVSPITAEAWRRSQRVFTDFPDFADAFLPNGSAPGPGEAFRFPEQAATLEAIARSHGDAFYRGELAERMAAHVQAAGGYLEIDDLAEHRPEWVGTLSAGYGDLELHEIPPNGQGLAALIALGILRHVPLEQSPVDSADSLHYQIEAMKLAFADAHCHIADPQFMRVDPDELLSDEYLRGRAAQIDPERAGRPEAVIPGTSGTVYLTAADDEGRMISFIQSNYHGFGSGMVVPGTGISLQNRGSGFVLESGHPNEVGGGKRPFHTIIPGFLMNGGQPLMSFGVMGGHMQPQGHLQMTVRVCLYGQNPQAASDAPRWRVEDDETVVLEQGFDESVVAELERRGHRVQRGRPDDYFAFGGAQAILRLTNGYLAASDHRKDGTAVGF